MRILILGAGVIGVSTAYELIKTGHDVTVIDRKPEPALETSYGNAGLIAPGHSYAWTTPKLPKNLFKSLYEKQRAFRFTFQWDLAMWRWGLQFIRQCTQIKMGENTQRKYRLSIYSQGLFQQLIDETGIQYYKNRKGLIYFFRSTESFLDGQEKLALLQPLMKNLQLLNRTELLELEPALQGTKTQIKGGIYCLTDESGSCRDFTLNLSKICRDKGVDFHFDTTVKEVLKYNNQIEKVVCDKGDFKADKYVLSFAAYSAMFAKMVGDYLPIYPVKGYSFTVPIIDIDRAPIHGGIDEDNLMAFSLMGDHIRFTSVAEISGYDTTCTPSDFVHMIELANSLFPNAFDFSQIEYWAGLRPMTPNGSPIFGRGKMRNLYFNTGHGHLGWTMCTGSAKITVDLIEGRKPEIDLEGMTLNTL